MSCEKSSKDRALTMYFLERLHRILLKQEEFEGKLNEEGVRLLQRTIFATVCDLKDLGHEDLARWCIEKRPRKLPPEEELFDLPKENGAIEPNKPRPLRPENG